MPAAPQPKSGHNFLPTLAWAGLVLAALLFLAVVDQQRIARLRYVTNTPSWSVDEPREDAASPTGYAGQRRRLVVPGHHTPSYHWIIRTQQGPAAVPHHLDYDNFPAGRTWADPSPYRWWLAGVARLDHAVTGRALPLAAEHSALYADPLLQALLVLAVAVFAGVQFGAAAGALAAVALVTLFPLAGGFQPGAPDHHALAWVFVIAAVLLLLAGLRRDRPRAWFALAGFAGGLVLWTDHLTGEPLLLGVALGAVAAALLVRRPATDTVAPALPWRTWGVAGGVTCLAAYALEYFPAGLEWSVDSIHPLHAVLCLGLGELLHRVTQWARTGERPVGARGWLVAALAVVAVAALPAARWLSPDGHFLANDPFAGELANLPAGVRAPGTGAWLQRSGLTAALAGTAAPLLAVGVAAWFLLSAKTPATQRRALAIALGPVVVALGLAWLQLRWWNAFDAAVVSLIVVLVAGIAASVSAARRWLGWTAIALAALPGLFLLAPPPESRGAAPLSEDELLAVVERDVAYWLTQVHGAEAPVVLTTPALSESLTYYGNIKAVASYAPENESGFSAAIRIASASTSTEAGALLENRRVTHLLLPSWDPTLRRLALLGRQLPADAAVPRDTLIANLEHWQIPPWLRPMTYHAPKDVGPGNLAVPVFAVQGEQDETLAECRLADYFLELGLRDEADRLRAKLRLYPRSLPALVALAQVDQAIGDRAGYDETMATLLPYVSRRAGRTLPVDRRISLAALLLQAKETDAARDQMQQCLAALDASRLRELTTGAIVRLLALNDLLGLTMPDPALRPLALSLLPSSLRARLEKPGDH